MNRTQRKLGKSANWVRKFARRTGSSGEKIVLMKSSLAGGRGETRSSGSVKPSGGSWFLAAFPIEHGSIVGRSIGPLVGLMDEITEFELFYQE